MTASSWWRDHRAAPEGGFVLSSGGLLSRASLAQRTGFERTKQSDDDLNGIVCGDASADVLRRLGEPSGILPHGKESLRSFFYRDLQINLILSDGIVDVLEVMDTGS